MSADTSTPSLPHNTHDPRDFYGVACLQRGGRSVEQRCQRSQVLPLTDDIIVHAAELYALLYQEGQLISDADILIAATALQHNLVMVTENVNHFRRIPGLSIESWRV